MIQWNVSVNFTFILSVLYATTESLTKFTMLQNQL